MIYFTFDYHSIQPGYKPGLYVGHYDPSGDKLPGHFFKLLYAETGQIKLLRIISRHNINHGGLTVSCKVNMHDGIADQVFKLAYYKAF